MRSSICIATARAFGASPGRCGTFGRGDRIAAQRHAGSRRHPGRQRAAARLADAPHAAWRAAGDQRRRCAVPAEPSAAARQCRPCSAACSACGSCAKWKQLPGIRWRGRRSSSAGFGKTSLSSSDADYLDMVLKKTCWLATIHPSRDRRADRKPRQRSISNRSSVSASISEPPSRFRTILLNIAPDPRYGKEANGDLLEGKRSLLLDSCLSPRLGRRAQQTDQAVSRPRDKRTRAGCQLGAVADGRDTARSNMCANSPMRWPAPPCINLSSIYGDLPPSRDKAFIHGLANWIFNR